jgi:hypothetical protein
MYMENADNSDFPNRMSYYRNVKSNGVQHLHLSTMRTLKTYTNGLNIAVSPKKSLSFCSLFLSRSLSLSLSIYLSAHCGIRSLLCLSKIAWSMQLQPILWGHSNAHTWAKYAVSNLELVYASIVKRTTQGTRCPLYETMQVARRHLWAAFQFWDETEHATTSSADTSSKASAHVHADVPNGSARSDLKNQETWQQLATRTRISWQTP